MTLDCSNRLIYEKDIRDILPADPFGMDISSTVTAINQWLEDYGGYRGAENDVCKGHDQIFGWNFCWDTTMDFHPMFRVDRFPVHYGSCTIGGVVFGDSFDDFVTNDAVFDCDCGGSSVNETVDLEVAEVVDETDDGSPHPALSFALAHLGVRDLLSVERVCKSLRFTVQNDPLLWMNIEIDHPLNSQITDDALVQLTSRAQGHLQCLSLVECKWITEEGLRRVLESNPRLTKLSVPGCIKLPTDGVMSCLKAFQPRAVHGIKCLRVAGRAVSLEQFEEFLSLLGINNPADLAHHSRHFYSGGISNLSWADDRPIDVEICPKCDKVKLVYDCTTQSCQAKDGVQLCRACIQCIHRCYRCGRCVDDVKHVETFCLVLVCSLCSPDSDCSPDLSKCQEGHDIGNSSLIPSDRDRDG